MNNKKTDRKLFWLLLGSSLITGLMVLPFTFSLIDLPPEIPLGSVIFAQMVQLAVLLSASIFFGLRMVRSSGLPGAPILEGLLSGAPWAPMPQSLPGKPYSGASLAVD